MLTISNSGSFTYTFMGLAVGFASFSVFCVVVRIRALNARAADILWGKKRGCQPVKKLNTGSWPFGLELIIRAFSMAKSQRILPFFVDLVEQTGYTFEQRLLGAVGIDTVEPRNIEAILSTQFAEFGLGDRRPTFFPLLGDGIFTQDGPAWLHSRSLLRPQFLHNRTQNFQEVSEHVGNLITHITPGKPINLQPLFFRFTFDITTFLLFGRNINTLAQGEQGKDQEFAAAFETAQDFLARRGRLGAMYWLIGGKEFRRACSVVHAFVDGIVRDALLTSEAVKPDVKYVILEALIQETRDPVVLRDQLLNVLLAGRDTTACLLSWTFRLLARHQSVLSRLRLEIQSTVGTGPSARSPERADLKKMYYLNLVLKEVLRLYPSVPVNARTALKTTTLPTGGGLHGKDPVLVRSGEAVGYCVYAMHRRKDLYGPDADLFRPERWEDDDGKLGKTIGYGYLPFNGGPRVCLGQEFALLEAGYVVVSLLQRFREVRLPEGEVNGVVGEEKQSLTLVLASAEGCWVQVDET